METLYQQQARVFKALCDPKRLAILEQLRSGEKCACILLEKLEISQPTLSHHMKILLKSGVVIPRKEGKWTHYSIDRGGSQYAVELLKALTKVEAVEIIFREDCK